jgi:hypothetical protein
MLEAPTADETRGGWCDGAALDFDALTDCRVIASSSTIKLQNLKAISIGIRID